MYCEAEGGVVAVSQDANLSVSLSFFLSLCLSIYLLIHLYICLFIFISICISKRLSDYIFFPHMQSRQSLCGRNTSSLYGRYRGGLSVLDSPSLPVLSIGLITPLPKAGLFLSPIAPSLLFFFFPF